MDNPSQKPLWFISAPDLWLAHGYFEPGIKKTGGKVPPVLLKWQSAWTCQGLEIKLKSGGQYQAIKATQDIFYLSEGHEILAYIKIGARTKVQADFTST